MKVRDLKQLLAKADDDMDVLIPLTNEFDGFFRHPCMEESGVTTLGVNENLGTEADSFLIVPCGFFNDHTDAVNPDLN